MYIYIYIYVYICIFRLITLCYVVQYRVVLLLTMSSSSFSHTVVPSFSEWPHATIMYMYIYIYIHIEREGEREGDAYMYIHIPIHTQMHRTPTLPPMEYQTATRQSGVACKMAP